MSWGAIGRAALGAACDVSIWLVFSVHATASADALRVTHLAGLAPAEREAATRRDGERWAGEAWGRAVNADVGPVSLHPAWKDRQKHEAAYRRVFLARLSGA